MVCLLIDIHKYPTWSDPLGVDPIGLGADRRRCSTLDIHRCRQFVERCFLSLYAHLQ